MSAANVIKIPALAAGEVYGVLTVHHVWALRFLPELWREHGADPGGDRARTVFAYHGIFWTPCPGLTKAAAELPDFGPEVRWGESLGIGFGSFRE